MLIFSSPCRLKDLLVLLQHIIHFIIIYKQFVNNFREYDFGDSLTIYDGDSEVAPVIGRYCGISIPPSHISSSNEMFLYFKTDIVYTDLGFKLKYQPYGKGYK